MGGFGSGRHAERPTVEACQALVLDLDVLLRARKGPVVQAEIAGTLGSLFKIGMRLSLDDEELAIKHGPFQHITSRVPGAFYHLNLVTEPAGFGGQQWFIRCPILNIPVRKVFLPNGAHRFASRRAYRLAYSSQRVDRMSASHGRMKRLFRKLGAPYPGAVFEEPRRPKGMHRQTYQRLLCELADARNAHTSLCQQDYEAWATTCFPGRPLYR